MGAPRLTDDEESTRSQIVKRLDKNTLRKDAALERIADAVSTICEVPIAHVSLMESEHQCVVGHIGLDMTSYDRDETFCAYTVAEKDILIVEDATDDP